MSENYIENHFGEIIGYESEIEVRMIDADCTKDSLKADNKRITEINELIPILTCSDLEKVREELKAKL